MDRGLYLLTAVILAKSPQGKQRSFPSAGVSAERKEIKIILSRAPYPLLRLRGFSLHGRKRRALV